VMSLRMPDKPSEADPGLALCFYVGYPRPRAADSGRRADPPYPRTSPSTLDGCASGHGGYTAERKAFLAPLDYAAGFWLSAGRWCWPAGRTPRGLRDRRHERHRGRLLR
jgi:hypothetical protein